MAQLPDALDAPEPLLKPRGVQALDEDEQVEVMQEAPETLTAEEAGYLRVITGELCRPEARDPKFAAVHAFLTQQYTSEGRTWLEQGCIAFSQFYDTVLSISRKPAGLLPREPIGVYAGAGRSGIYLGMDFAAVERESIKAAVKSREIRLVLATDAACEGLNLHSLRFTRRIRAAADPDVHACR